MVSLWVTQPWVFGDGNKKQTFANPVQADVRCEWGLPGFVLTPGHSWPLCGLAHLTCPMLSLVTWELTLTPICPIFMVTCALQPVCSVLSQPVCELADIPLPVSM